MRESRKMAPVMREDRSGARRGITLTETLLALAILAALVCVAVQLAARAREISRHAPLLDRANEISQGILEQLRSELLSSVKLFQNDPLGIAYLGILDMTDASPAVESVLPASDPDTLGSPKGRTGNTVLFARYAWTDDYECASGNRYTAEVYRLVRNYLAEAPAESVRPSGSDFCRWVSEPMVDGNQVDEITDATDRAEVLNHFLTGTPGVGGKVRPRVEVAWRPAGDPAAAGTLRQIGPGGFLSSAPRPSRGPQWRILRDADRSSNGLLDGEPFAVASEVGDPGPGIGEHRRRGFEVQITGPSGARRVLLELVIVSTGAGRLPACSSLRIAVNTRDF